ARKDLPYPDLSGVLTTAGGIVVTAMLDGTILAFDDQTLDTLWEVNVGTGFVAPPMTYAVNGEQSIALAAGIDPVGTATMHSSPELKSQGNATMLFVFGL